MKKILFIIFSLLTFLAVTSCQDEDFGFTEEDVFKGVYARNFKKAFGQIDPNENWDFSRFGRRHVGDMTTRAGEPEYIVSEALRDGFLRNTLAEGVNHKDASNTFCLLSGNDHFSLTPIYRSGSASAWNLHIVLFTPDNQRFDREVWSNTMDNVLEIHTDNCEICHNHGYVNQSAASVYKGSEMQCPNCIEGYLDAPTSAGELPTKTCDHCDANGKVENGDCTQCHGAKTFTCNTCGGKGYTFTGNGKNREYYSCRSCGSGGFIFKGKQKELKTPENQKKLNEIKGTGFTDCTTCNGTGKSYANCDICGGDKKLYTCPVCLGSDNVYKCIAPYHNDAIWTPITGTSLPAGAVRDTKTATGIKGYTYSTSEIFKSDLGGKPIPTGSIFYFYLETSKVASSMDGGMQVYYPQAIGSNAMIIGCEEGDGDNDYNDLVFLLQGTPTVIPAIQNVDFTTKVMKRYMAEDFGSNSDWDFNDVVVDMVRTTVQKLQKNTAKVLTKTTIKVEDYATIKWLGGTAPIQISIGGTQLPIIENPTDHSYTTDVLNGELEEDRVHDPENKWSIGWEVGLSFLITPDRAKQGWDPDTNNITIAVWRDWDKSGEVTKSSDTWHATFPTLGTVPFIIATDVTVAYVKEDGKSFDFSNL